MTETQAIAQRHDAEALLARAVTIFAEAAALDRAATEVLNDDRWGRTAEIRLMIYRLGSRLPARSLAQLTDAYLASVLA